MFLSPVAVLQVSKRKMTEDSGKMLGKTVKQKKISSFLSHLRSPLNIVRFRLC